MKKVIVVLVLCVFAACGGSSDDSSPTPAPGGPDPEYEGSWALESGHSSDGPIPIVHGYPVTFELEGEQARGSAACNSFGGGISVEGSEFDAGSFATSEVGCDPEVMRSQEHYLDALADAERIVVQGDTMTLTGPGTELVFRRVPPVKTEALVDTTWALDTLLDGAEPDAAATPAKGGALTLSSDGTFEGSTGCRRFSGEWTASGDTILLTTMTFTGECEEALAGQEQHVVGALGAGFKPSVKGDELTVTAARGTLGLVYREKR